MKTKKIIFLFLLSISFSMVFSQKYDNKTVSLKGKRILLFTKNGKGYIHDNISVSVKAFFKLSLEQGFQLDTSSNASVFTNENLKKYHALVFSNTNNEVFDTEAQKVAVMRYIQAGGGFVGIHIACGTERNWVWFKQMLGGTFLFHPVFQEFNVRVLDKEHPSCKNIPDPWVVKDELYFLKEMNPTIRVLMVSDFSKMTDKRPMPETFGKVFPCVWCNTYDGGRQWYTALGHDKRNYENPLYMRHILGGLQWVTAQKVDYTKAYATKSEITDTSFKKINK